jgi:hypothetical protein
LIAKLCWRNYAVGKVRAFDTGATRDADDEKFDPEGFIDPRVLFAYSKYMHKNRHQSDGTLRASDNWQKGIPQDQYMKSLLRHVMDLWADHRGCPQSRNEDGQVPPLDETLGGILFNAMGYWHEELKRAPRGWIYPIRDLDDNTQPSGLVADPNVQISHCTCPPGRHVAYPMSSLSRGADDPR